MSNYCPNILEMSQDLRDLISNYQIAIYELVNKSLSDLEQLLTPEQIIKYIRERHYIRSDSGTSSTENLTIESAVSNQEQSATKVETSRHQDIVVQLNTLQYGARHDPEDPANKILAESENITTRWKGIRQTNIKKFSNRRMMCTFCKKNGELSVVYKSHSLRDKNGSITCPILQELTCLYCGATGINAHTKRYCPKMQEGKFRPIEAFPENTEEK